MTTALLILCGPLGWIIIAMKAGQKPAATAHQPHARGPWDNVKARRFAPWTAYPTEDR